ncbi:MAG: DEAD/DEAH box helicase [Firmicutes bacterium]|uniref:DEAD/DEAH box helicase n=1 Tax=Candidatus Gallilactobacillus intestinavium TaxID=2840838 RepID=A0A9D9H9M4_9LACO|nr:DEAD/DEAH box helicase [Candidatus Gallilactobacillus intestinavium]
MTKKFSDFGLNQKLVDSLKEIGFYNSTSIQEQIIPLVLKGKNVVGKSQTGSGKTHAFIIPILNNLNKTKLQSIIIAPSRELSEQIFNYFKELSLIFDKDIKIATYIGGTDREQQLYKIKKEVPQVIIGTPGRIKDLLSDSIIETKYISSLVIDEADMTMDMGFIDDIDYIFKSLPIKKQIMFFSATFSQKMKVFLKKYLPSNTVFIDNNETFISENIDNFLIFTKGRDHNLIIKKLLNIYNPYLGIIFCNTRNRAEEVYRYLKESKLKVVKISGDIPSRRRRQIIKQIRDLKYQYVVATDLAARGIDIDEVSLVINDDIPYDRSFFVHRIGRTGRSGTHGTALTLYDPEEENKVSILEKNGIRFINKEIGHNKIIDHYDRDRRKKRVKDHTKLDPGMLGLIKKKKKKVKPGYKRQIKQRIKIEEQYKRRVKKRNNK